MPLQTTDLATTITTTAQLIAAKPAMTASRLEDHVLALYDEAITAGDDEAADVLAELSECCTSSAQVVAELRKITAAL